MKKNKNTTATFAKQVAEAEREGYVVMPQQYSGGGKGREQAAPTSEEVMNAAIANILRNDPAFVGKHQPAEVIAPAPVSTIASTPKGVGTPGLGLVTWGVGNRYPNIISMFTSLLPYTAIAAKFNVDVAAGMGFTPKYRYSAISNGALVTKEIDYDSAGALLENQLIEARKDLASFYQGINQNLQSVQNGLKEVNDQLEQSYLKRIARVEEDLAKWEVTKNGVKDFTNRNNLPLLALHLFNDMVLFGICFPELELSKQATNQPDNAQWKPTVTGITYREAHTCRVEEMDDNGRINYIYQSWKWLDHPEVVESLSADEMTAIPAIDPEHPSISLEDMVRQFRTNNANGSPDDRPTRFIYPSYYPTAGRPYYPQQPWHSIFGGDIYSYLATIVSDRAKRRKNKNILGYIIYVHQQYIETLIRQRQQELERINPKRKGGVSLTQEEKKQIVDEMWKTINTFLAERDNAGKPLLAQTFTGSDGKDHDAYRIVEVPNATAKDAQAQKTELEEISAIVFFAFQCHPELIGAVPGRTGAGGGTYQRELYLLKLLQMAPTQQLVLRVLDTITEFNSWDEHLVWRIRQQVPTTLDRSGSGLVESETN